MVEFRRSLAASFLFRFFLLSSYQLAADAASFEPNIPDTYKSAVKVCKNVCSQVLSSLRSFRASVVALCNEPGPRRDLGCVHEATLKSAMCSRAWPPQSVAAVQPSCATVSPGGETR